MKAKIFAIVLIVGALGAIGVLSFVMLSQPQWTDEEIDTLKSLWIGSLGQLPPDPSNAYADNPAAAELGQQLFFDTRFSGNGQVSCATCHQPDLAFTDGRAQSKGIGETRRSAPSLVGLSYSPWYFWDGRKDSQWAQALGPMEDANEHGGNRTQYAHLISENYREAYEAVFGALPDLTSFPASAGPVADAEASDAWRELSFEDRETVSRIYANMGKAIAAYQRHIQPGASRFDEYVQALLEGDKEKVKIALSTDEVAGLRLFMGKGSCTQCHNGPMLANNDFHSTGTPLSNGVFADRGRTDGMLEVIEDEFNCLSKYSDADPEACVELRFLPPNGSEFLGAFKTPTLRNVAETAPYMHAGQMATLEEVMDHYNEAPAGPHSHTDLFELNLTDQELAQLVAYMKTLSGPVFAP